eukprot:Plantae.Rhodophyta-Purpureofilum_apyrenoidigerum.ctg11153.p1 GENE.Plantae.Rhodophyta-Purpureofilum_apyrenoidigerum.ctg11153~~Plantae.Rhodophyta-Purpureofilum_apyrenoidigerum.ctg11153.p1  ORF type:complete len:241 (-),score=43.23 Plantae.Rhodophyta-Purpureofilum_apyrenoidigerum.ctg11153:192-824(-)
MAAFVAGVASVRKRRRQVCTLAMSNEALLMSMVAGTNRGKFLDERRKKSVENIVSMLERENPTAMKFPQNLSILDGCWRLVYTTRPLPPSITPLGHISGIYQKMDSSKRRIENIIEFDLMPFMPTRMTSKVAIGSRFETLDNSRLKLWITDVSVKLGRLEPPAPLSMPTMRISDAVGIDGTEEVETTYLADGLRVLRSRKGDIRVFVQEH